MFKYLSSHSAYLSQIFPFPTSHYYTRSASTLQINLPPVRTSFRQNHSAMQVLLCGDHSHLIFVKPKTSRPSLIIVNNSFPINTLLSMNELHVY